MKSQNVKTFVTILGIGLICACIPFMALGLVFGALPVIINTVLLSLIFKKELYGNV